MDCKEVNLPNSVGIVPITRFKLLLFFLKKKIKIKQKT